MKIVVLCLLLFGSGIPSQNREPALEVGSKLPSELIPKNPDFITLPDFLPVLETRIDGVVYEVAYYPSNNIVRYIFTSDERFKTADGKHVGMCIPISKEQVGSTRGGLTRLKTKDNWTPVIGYRSNVTTCQKRDNGSVLTLPLKDMLADEKVEVKIIKFMK